MIHTYVGIKDNASITTKLKNNKLYKILGENLHKVLQQDDILVNAQFTKVHECFPSADKHI